MVKQTSIQNACQHDEELKYKLSCKEDTGACQYIDENHVIIVTKTCVKCGWELDKISIKTEEKNNSRFEQRFLEDFYDFLRG